MAQKLNFGQSIKAALFAGLASAVVNAVLFYIFRAVGVLTDDVMVQPDTPLTIAPVIMSSILPSVIAGIVFFLFDKFSNNGYKYFRITAIVLLFLSFLSPFMAVKGAPLSYLLVLCIMHIVVAAGVLYFIRKAKES